MGRMPLRTFPFGEFVEGEDESREEGSDSEDALFDDFDRDASGGAFVDAGTVMSVAPVWRLLRGTLKSPARFVTFRGN